MSLPSDARTQGRLVRPLPLHRSTAAAGVLVGLTGVVALCTVGLTVFAFQ